MWGWRNVINGVVERINSPSRGQSSICCQRNSVVAVLPCTGRRPHTTTRYDAVTVTVLEMRAARVCTWYS